MKLIYNYKEYQALQRSEKFEGFLSKSRKVIKQVKQPKLTCYKDKKHWETSLRNEFLDMKRQCVNTVKESIRKKARELKMRKLGTPIVHIRRQIEDNKGLIETYHNYG